MAAVQKNDDEFKKAQVIFDSLKEANGNVLTVKLADYLKKQGMDDAWVAKAMNQIDVNGDNELTWAEFGTKGIRIVHQLKLHSDFVRKQAAAKPAAAPAPTPAPAASAPKTEKKPATSSSSSSSSSSKSSSSSSKSSSQKSSKTTFSDSDLAVFSARFPAVSTTSSSALTDESKNDLPLLANPKTKNVKLALRTRTKEETQELIKAEASTSSSSSSSAERKQKKKIIPNKPTKEERAILRRLRKHDSSKAPPYAQVLAAKYSKKKAATKK